MLHSTLNARAAAGGVGSGARRSHERGGAGVEPPASCRVAAATTGWLPRERAHRASPRASRVGLHRQRGARARARDEPRCLPRPAGRGFHGDPGVSAGAALVREGCRRRALAAGGRARRVRCARGAGGSPRTVSRRLLRAREPRRRDLGGNRAAGPRKRYRPTLLRASVSVATAGRSPAWRMSFQPTRSNESGIAVRRRRTHGTRDVDRLGSRRVDLASGPPGGTSTAAGTPAGRRPPAARCRSCATADRTARRSSSARCARTASHWRP